MNKESKIEIGRVIEVTDDSGIELLKLLDDNVKDATLIAIESITHDITALKRKFRCLYELYPFLKGYHISYDDNKITVTGINNSYKEDEN